jgi:hypothetical protein
VPRGVVDVSGRAVTKDDYDYDEAAARARAYVAGSGGDMSISRVHSMRSHATWARERERLARYLRARDRGTRDAEGQAG